MSKRLVFVDGYNLIRNDPTLSAIEARSLDAGRRALVSRFQTSYNLQENEVTIVFDGANAPALAPASERSGQVKVIYSRRGETADEVITRLVGQSPQGSRVLVLSDDGQVRGAAQARGAIVGGRAERARPRPTPTDLSGKNRDKDAGDRPHSTEKKGNPRRAKRRARRPSDVSW